MKTKIRILRKEEQQTAVWSGGTTTQLAIWPPEAEYALRNFKWRISTARVDGEKSTFTSLPGIHRLLMILEGETRLIHEGHHVIRLVPFEQDSFEGDWSTCSQGRCVDFNLMTAEGCTGCVEALKTALSGLTVSLFSAPLDRAPLCREIAEAFYSLSPRMKMTVRDEKGSFTATLGQGDFVLLRGTSSDGAQAVFSTDTKDFPLIRATIWRNSEENAPS